MDDRPTSRLIREALSEAKELAQLEMRLARAELGAELMQLRRAAILTGVAFALALLALSTLVLALVIALGGTVPVALSAGGTLLVLAVGLALLAYRMVPKVPLQRTRTRLREDIGALKESAGLTELQAPRRVSGPASVRGELHDRPSLAAAKDLVMHENGHQESVPPSSRRPITRTESGSAPAAERMKTAESVKAAERVKGEKNEKNGGKGWRHRLASAASLVKETGTQWSKDEAARLAASLALYTLLSVAPLLVIAVSIAGMVFGADAARGQISQQISTVVGPQAGKAIEGLVANAQNPSAGIIGSVVGTVVLLFGASGVFGELQSALNRIWDVKPKPGRGIMGVLRDRFLSFSMVMGVAFLLLVSLLVNAALAGLTTHFQSLVPMPGLWHAFVVLVGLGLTTVLFALMFKVVPDAKISWRDVWVGGFATALAFSIGRVALAWYVGRSSTVSPFGAAGSLVALVVWIYYSAQILFLGAEFTQVYASHYGSRIVPTENAVPIDEDAAETATGSTGAVPSNPRAPASAGQRTS